jgi:hypothetical protein
MDDLDRLYYEFVEILRRERPALLREPFTVLELHDQLIPYRRVRNPVGLLSNDDYEAVVSRLLSGERGYVLGDAVVQGELRSGLEEALPDIRRYRAFPEARIWLDTEQIPPPGHIRYAPPEVREGTDWLEAIETQELESEPPVDPGQPAEAAAEGTEAAAEETAGEEAAASEAGPCPVCAATVPGAAAFCPFCGARLAPGTCRICGASLDAAWRFCAGCGTPREGRQAESP